MASRPGAPAVSQQEQHAVSTTAEETATKTYRNLIGGKWVDASSGKTFRSVSPANHDEVIGVFAASGAEDVDAAVAAARDAFPSWSLMPAPKRGEILFK
jgi:acyl-CoA reductase-like NAD-dependent aldehyde dehydrogenase